MRVNTSELITATEAAELAGIALSTFTAYVARGEAGIPGFVPIGGRRFYRRADIEAWAAARAGGVS